PLGSSSPSSTSSPVIGHLCASPELQFRWPISGEEAELLSDPGGKAHRWPITGEGAADWPRENRVQEQQVSVQCRGAAATTYAGCSSTILEQGQQV
ncbi:unnamed protein product, partial [Staurois parvus]